MTQAYGPLKSLLLGMAAMQSLDQLLAGITTTIAEQPDVALARVWLLAPGDQCDHCPLRVACRAHVDCLQLVASAGRPLTPDADWSRLDGAFRRIPSTHGKVGRALQEPAGVTDISVEPDGIADPSWVRREGLRGFGAAPLRFGKETLGVLGVFTRAPFDLPMHEWLRIIADHAAAAIAAARAFEENERLREALQLHNDYLSEQLDAAKAGAMIGDSSAMRRVQQAIEDVAPTEANVLITGPSGTGKELVAAAVHRLSRRADAPFIKVNCASVPRELFESEFFGHVRGAFTGAVRDRAGRFQLADGGTLFLDEVGEIPPEMQSKLLRVLQDGRYERIGEERTRTADVRVLAATNRPLQQAMQRGTFREDLFFRLNVFPIDVPPLRERKEDIGALARHFVILGAQRLSVAPRALREEDVRRLQGYGWPGNVRELQNVVERALIRARSAGRAGEVGLRFELPGGRADAGTVGLSADPLRGGVLTEAQLQALEANNLRAALAACNGKVHGPDGAAKLLGLRPSTLRSRLKKHGLG